MARPVIGRLSPALGLLVAFQSGAEAPRDPAPRTELAGMSAVVARSRLVFRSAPDQPHELIATFAFPDRGRMWIAPEGARGRRLRFAYGEHAFALDPGSPSSLELSGDERRNTLRQLMLRRAVLLWPDGACWNEAGAEGRRLADLGELGSLEAVLGEDGLPSEVRSRDADGEPYERLVEIQWRAGERRTWPTRFALAVGDSVVWDEQLVSIDPTARYIDAFFVPPDRRPPVAGATPDERVVSVDVPAMAFRRIPLAEGTGWDAALAAADRARVRAGEELGDERGLDRFTTLELDTNARPRAILLRLDDAARELPDGFEPRDEFPAVSVLLGELAEVGGALGRLRTAAGPGLHGTPYARIAPADRAGSGARVQLVLPLEQG